MPFDENQLRTKAFRKDDKNESFLKELNNYLDKVELKQAYLSPNQGQQLPMIYVVGLPRSGTTLCSQLLARYLPIGYINNIIARFWQAPEVGIALSRCLFEEHQRNSIALQSTHGVTHQLEGPHEFGYFWNYWFQLARCKNHHLSPSELERIDTNKLADAINRRILEAFGLPVMIKNPICGFQAPLLTEVHPKSLFICTDRDDYSVVCSILRCRKERYGTYKQWWSLKPSTFPFSQSFESPVDEVIKQVKHCRLELHQQIASSNAQVLHVDYKTLCNSPMDFLLQVCDILGKMDYFLKPNVERLEPLKAAKPQKTPVEIAERIQYHRDLGHL